MHPKTQSRPQDELFRSRLEQIIDLKHPLCQLADTVSWSYFEQEFGHLYVEKRGRPGKPLRLKIHTIPHNHYLLPFSCLSISLALLLSEFNSNDFS